MEKAHLVAQPFQLIAQQRREAYELSGSGGRQRKRFADDSGAVPPEEKSRESLTHKLLTENQKLSCSKHLVSQVSQRPESKTKEKAGKRHAHFSPHT